MGRPLIPGEKLRRTVSEVQRAQLDELGYLQTARWRFLTSIPASRQQTLEALGQGVHEVHQAATQQAGTLGRVRSRLLAPPHRRRGVPAWAWAVAGSASLAAVALLVIVPMLRTDEPPLPPAPSAPGSLRSQVARSRRGRQAPLTFTVDERVGQVGRQVVTAPSDEPVALRFSDRSLLHPERGSRLRVLTLKPTGARILLEQGALRAHVVPRDNSSWTINVGPFEVRVKGTRFRVSWDPSDKRFGLEMHAGRVEVRGPVVGRRELSAGQSVAIRVDDRRVALRRAADTADAAVVPSAAVPAAQVPEEKRPVATIARPQVRRSAREPVGQPPSRTASSTKTISPNRPTEPSTAPPTNDSVDQTVNKSPTVNEAPVAIPEKPTPPAPAPTLHADTGPVVAEQVVAATPWELALRGASRDAVRAGDQSGWASLMSSATSTQLIALAGAAQAQHRAALAIELLEAVRQRFPDSSAAAQAAYTLGCVHFHQQQKPEVAARWFEVYLTEQPSGPLAREARGRLVESLRGAGLDVRACAAARAYLVSHPQGPHARFVRAVVAGCGAKGASGDTR